MRVVALLALCVALAGCKRGTSARIKKDAPEGITPAAIDAAPPAPGDIPTATPVSPPLVPLGHCQKVLHVMTTWARAQAAYAALLPRAIRENWNGKRFNDEVTARLNAEAPPGSAGAIDTSPGKGAHTNPCTCITEGIDEECQRYAAHGQPAILCDATKLHENVHVKQCQTNKTLPAGHADRYPCPDPEHSGMTPPQRARQEIEAYAALLDLLWNWYGDNKCPEPLLPTNACKLASEADAADALGRNIARTEHTDIGMFSTCTFHGQDQSATATSFSGAKMATVAVSITKTRVTREVFEKRIVPENAAATDQPAKPVDGVGEVAFAIGGDKHTGTVLAFQRGVVITTIVWIQEGATRDLTERAKLLAMIALSHAI